MKKKKKEKKSFYIENKLSQDWKRVEEMQQINVWMVRQ